MLRPIVTRYFTDNVGSVRGLIVECNIMVSKNGNNVPTSWAGLDEKFVFLEGLMSQPTLWVAE